MWDERLRANALTLLNATRNYYDTTDHQKRFMENHQVDLTQFKIITDVERRLFQLVTEAYQALWQTRVWR